MFSEDDLLPISALQHLLFCERQCALIHVERLWVENRFTIEGKQLHEKAHEAPSESRPGVRIVRGLPLRSLRLGLVGIADVVEFHRSQHGSELDLTTSSNGDIVSPLSQEYTANPPGRPFPVEYKRGKPKSDDSDKVQLCAQALCLEEMFGVSIEQGALFYGRPRRRQEVAIATQLRRTTEEAARRLRELVTSRVTPTAKKQAKCRRCSMLGLCMPGVTGSNRSADNYLKRRIFAENQTDSP